MSDDNLIEIIDYSPWENFEVFGLNEAAYLIAGYEPRVNAQDHPAKINRIAKDLLEIWLERRDGCNHQGLEKEVCDILIEDIKTYVLMTGAQSKFLERRKNLSSRGSLKELSEIKKELAKTKEQLEVLKLENQNLRYQSQGLNMNPEHPLFAPELETAVAVWTSLFSERTEIKEKGKTSKKLIENWIKENRTDLSKEAIERIKTLANPANQKKGGAPKTEY